MRKILWQHFLPQNDPGYLEPELPELTLENFDLSKFPRCDACFRRQRICDGNSPCLACETDGQHCIKIRKTSLEAWPNRALRLLKNLQQRALTDGEADSDGNMCRRCLTLGIKCKRSTPTSPCDQCVIKGARCMERPLLPENKTKCFQCARAHSRCTGGIPCTLCIKRKFTCIESTSIDKAKCLKCTRYGKMCDRGKPCKTCIDHPDIQTYSYVEQTGLVDIRYAATEGLTFKADPEGICLYCSISGRPCDKGEPCLTCIIYRVRPNRDIAPCTYNRNTYKELWSTKPWTTEIDPETKAYYRVFDGEYLQADPRRQKQVANVERSHGHFVEKPKSLRPTYEQYEESDTVKKFKAMLKEDFPDGWMSIMVSGKSLLYGLRAIIASLRAQAKNVEPVNLPTVEDLHTIALKNKAAQIFKDTQIPKETEHGVSTEPEDFDNNFQADHLASVLFQWSTMKGYDMQLGVIRPYHDPIVFENDDPTATTQTIWIVHTPGHYNGARHRSKKSKQKPKEIPIIIKTPNREPSSDEDVNNRRWSRKRQIDDDIDEFINEGSHMETKPNSKKTALVIFANMAKSRSENSEPNSYAEAMRLSDATEWQGAVDREIESLQKNGVFQEVNAEDVPSDKRLLTGRMVFRKKTIYNAENDEYKTKYKARLVAKGFQQEEGINYKETFATIVKAASYKTLIAIAARRGMTIYCMDVKTAFLYGDIDVDLYMKPPAGYKCQKGRALRICKALYGLKQSPRMWYAKLTNVLIHDLKFRVSKYNPCVFIHDAKRMILALWVDDIMVLTHTEADADAIMNQLTKHFEMVNEGKCTFYLGMNMVQTTKGIMIHQKHYLQQALARFGKTNLPPVKTPLKPGTILQQSTTEATTAQKNAYASQVGSLNWLSNQTRFDILFAVSLLSRFTSNPNQSHFDSLDHVWAYLNSHQDLGPFYKRGSGETLDVVGMVDSDYAVCPDTRRSVTGWVFTLGGGPISCCSQRQKSSSLSTTDAEYIAAAEAAREAIWLKGFVNDLHIADTLIAIPLFIDNNAVLKLSKNPELHQRTKHIDVRYHFLRQRVTENKDLITLRVNTEENTADMLTKALAPPKFVYFRAKMGILSLRDKAE